MLFRSSFSQVFGGSVDGDRVVVSGRLDTSTINSDSLYASGERGGESNCVALILSTRDHERGKSLSGQLVEVRGRPLGMGDLRTLFPNSYGQIEGRPWSGTYCNGQFAIFVDDLRVPDNHK